MCSNECAEENSNHSHEGEWQQCCIAASIECFKLQGNVLCKGSCWGRGEWDILVSLCVTVFRSWFLVCLDLVTHSPNFLSSEWLHESSNFAISVCCCEIVWSHFVDGSRSWSVCEDCISSWQSSLWSWVSCFSRLRSLTTAPCSRCGVIDNASSELNVFNFICWFGKVGGNWESW